VAAYRRIVIVGASLAGLRAAEALREHGHTGALTVIGEEAHLPYDRPPLSKHVLTGRVEPTSTGLRAAGGLDLDWRLGARATGVDLERSVVALGAGDDVPFDGLVIATGSHARTLPSLPARPGVHVLRTLDDAVALRTALEHEPRVVVIGAGFIGLEVAASARALNLDVTILEVAPVPLVRSVGARIGPVLAGLHRDHGVDVRFGVDLDGLVGAGRVEGVRLAGSSPRGEIVPADVVVVGVGAAPTTAWLAASGIDVADGVRADSRLRVLARGRVLPHVVAAGDVARWDHPDWGVPARVEHWSNAVEQGQAAALSLLRGEEAAPFSPVPYFWSDQYDHKIQMVGRAAPDDEVVIIDGSIAEHRFVAAYGRDGRLVAALGFNRPAKVMRLQRQIAKGAAFSPSV
jgi:3-phenylpropionate/trans-cinnamate dioxygenase ferredoxin reductase component